VEKGALLRIVVFLAFIALIYATQRFWFVHSWHWIQNVSRPGLRRTLQGLWWTAFVLLLLAFLDPFLGHVFPRRGPGSWVIAISRLWLVASVFALLAYGVVSLFGWTSTAVTKLVAQNPEVIDEGRRGFFRYAAYLAGALPLLGASYGFAAGRFRYQVQKIDVPIPNLPEGLDGLKIVQLSDIHIGDFMPRDEVQRAVAMANELEADLAVVTGDFISNEFDPLEDCIRELSRLRAPLGTWGCNGNHEIYARAEASAQQLFQQYGMKLLRQENVEIAKDGAKFNLIGVDYQRDHMTRGPRGPMLQGIESLIRRDIPNVLLSHNPNSFRRAAELGIELSLAGHTHGGQVKFEIVDHSITPARLITDFVAGLYHLPQPSGTRSSLYVNRGLGTFGMPVRLGVPPEITLLTLKTA
jgi:predicted MPP superfamily phosphohydrolase